MTALPDLDWWLLARLIDPDRHSAATGAILAPSTLDLVTMLAIELVWEKGGVGRTGAVMSRPVIRR